MIPLGQVREDGKSGVFTDAEGTSTSSKSGALPARRKRAGRQRSQTACRACRQVRPELRRTRTTRPAVERRHRETRSPPSTLTPRRNGRGRNTSRPPPIQGRGPPAADRCGAQGRGRTGRPDRRGQRAHCARPTCSTSRTDGNPVTDPRRSRTHPRCARPSVKTLTTGRSTASTRPGKVADTDHDADEGYQRTAQAILDGPLRHRGQDDPHVGEIIVYMNPQAKKRKQATASATAIEFAVVAVDKRRGAKHSGTKSTSPRATTWARAGP